MPKFKKRLWKTDKSPIHDGQSNKNEGKGDHNSDEEITDKPEKENAFEAEISTKEENDPESIVQDKSSPEKLSRQSTPVKKEKKKTRGKKSRRETNISEQEDSNFSKESYVMVNLKELDKLQQIFSNSKGDFLATTYKFKKPIKDYKIRIRLMKYPSLTEKENCPPYTAFLLEERLFSWQEKVFSKEEASRYSNMNLTDVSPLEELYQKEVKKEDNIGKYLHSYVDCDKYVAAKESRSTEMHYPMQLNGFTDSKEEKNESPVTDDTSWVAKQNEKAAKADAVAEQKRKKLEDKLERQKEQKESKMMQERLKKKVEMEEHDQELTERRKLEEKVQKQEHMADKKKTLLSSKRPSVVLSARMRLGSPSSTPRMMTKKEFKKKKGKMGEEQDHSLIEGTSATTDKTKNREMKESSVRRMVSAGDDQLKKSISMVTLKEQDKLRSEKKRKSRARFKSVKLVKKKRPAWPVECPQVMFIMAAIPKQIRTREKSETVCEIKAYPKSNLVSIKPPFGYRTVQGNYNDIYRLSWELYNEEEAEAYDSNRNRLSVTDSEIFQLQENFQVVGTNEISVVVMGEILFAKNFDSEPISVHYVLDLPKGWRKDSLQSSLEGVTQCSYVDDHDKANFSHNLFFQLTFSLDEEMIREQEICSRPLLLLMVTSRKLAATQELTGIKCEGYGYVNIPNEPGSHFLTVKTWRLKPRTIRDQMRAVFLNNGPFLDDIHAAYIPSRNSDEPCNKLGLQTEPSGTVTLRLHVIHQTPTSPFSKEDNQKLELLNKMSSATILKSVHAVIRAFHSAAQKAEGVKQKFEE